MKIRYGKKTDKKEYLKTQKEAFPNLDVKRDTKFFLEKVKNKEIFIVEEKGEYVGHSCFQKYLYDPPFAVSVFGQEMAVKKKFRGNGYGSALRKRLIQYCKKNKIPVIYNATGDYKGNKAIKFHKKHGFKVVGKLKEVDPNSEYKYGQIFMALQVP
ncbi:GNAT family N-acetyltransferase [archaeon]|jgi:L-amino acid N-acyltransferase YncA|nr:GNAT family N-acetyltransferase [archaeon]MBT4417116.1 GNAT family N-acetyltransferase [archaeon]